jgi:putative tricarboxylic transport membrane protein
VARTRGARRAEFAVALGVLVLGAVASVVAFGLPEGGGYARIGPNFVPRGVAAALVLLGLWLLADAIRGGWRMPVPDEPADRGDHTFEVGAFLWVAAGLAAQMALIHTAGFPIAAAALFVCVARGFGSRRPGRDALIGMGLGLAVFLFFVRFLNVNLPAGWLLPLLGAAGT